LAKWMGFQKPLQLTIPRFFNTDCSGFQKPVHVTTSNYRKPLHDCTHGLQENLFELLSFVKEQLQNPI
jgi:hypothetical protein